MGKRLSHLINKSLNAGIFPAKWKEAVVVPVQAVVVPKVRETIKMEEFRPVNKLPIYEKILEIVV